MSYELKRRLSRYFTIMDLVLSGQSRKAIADEVGMTPMAISNVTEEVSTWFYMGALYWYPSDPVAERGNGHLRNIG